MCEYKIKPDHISSVRSKEREQEDDLTYHGSNDKAFGIHHQEDADARFLLLRAFVDVFLLNDVSLILLTTTYPDETYST